MERQDTINECVAKHIWNDILQCSMKPFAWRFEFKSVKAIENGTSFRVNANFIIGLVEIRQTGSCYTITIKPDNYGGSLIYEDITADNLVSTIDRVVREGIIVDNTQSQKNPIAA